MINLKKCIAIFIFAYFVNTQSCDGHQFNVILINLTSARADHLKTYGYKRNTAPNIDKLAKEALVFEQAIAQSHWTLPSNVSILTSKYVNRHGVYERNQKVSDKELTLPEILKMYDYKTAAFVGGLDLVATYGLSQGFDYYFDDTKDKPMGSFKDIIPKAIKWLRENKDNKFFLFIQGYDVHPPFNKPKLYEDIYDSDYNGLIDELSLGYQLLKNIRNNNLLLDGKTVRLTEKDINHIIAYYDGGITYADNFIGKLLKEINKLALSDRTIIIITSEHGEELSDHGSFDRFGQNNLYDEVIRVPLIIKNPNIDLKGERITSQVQLIDIMPTILDFLGIPINKESQGLSLVPLMQKKDVKDNFNQYAYSEANPHKWAIRTKEWKLIYDKEEYELYSLRDDKAEINNLARQRPELVYELIQKLLEWRRNTRTERSPDDTRLELSEEMKRKLREAGYW